MGALAYRRLAGSQIDRRRRASGKVVVTQPSPAARTDRAPFARERHEPLERAVPAPHAGEAVAQHPAAEKFPELVYDEPGETTAVRLRVDGGDELGEVRAHDPRRARPWSAIAARRRWPRDPPVAGEGPAPSARFQTRRRFT